MQAAGVVSQAAQLSTELTRELDSVADRAFQLSQQLALLHSQSQTTYSDKAMQVDFGPASHHNSWVIFTPHAELDAARRLAPFAFASGTARKINWPRIRSLSIDQLVAETDTRSLMELFDELAHTDLDAESGYNLTEGNLIKVVQLCQLLLQYMQWNVEQGAHMVQLLQEERMGLIGGVRPLPDLSLKAVDQGLEKLGKDYVQVADADLDAMFVQVRTEERTAAHDTLAVAMEAAKQEIQARCAALPDVAAGPSAAPGVSALPLQFGQALDVGGRRDQGMQVYVATGPDTTAAAAAAAIAAASAAAQPRQPTAPAAYGYSMPVAASPMQAAGVCIAQAAGAGPQQAPVLSRSQAYHNALADIPPARASDPAAAQVQQQLLAARLSGTPAGTSGATPGSPGRGLFGDGQSMSLTAIVRNKQAAEAAAGGPWDSVQASSMAASTAAQAMPPGAPVQPTGLAAAMASYEAQRQPAGRPQRVGGSLQQYSFTSSVGVAQQVVADPFTVASGGATESPSRAPATAAAWSEATGQALFRPGLATGYQS